jgi:radical SAM protein with 4Fe4S-binding SPASM domain
VTKLNICEVENVIQFAEEKNIFCDVMAVVPVGRATADTMPQPQQYRELIARLLKKWRALPMNAIGCKAFSSWKTRVSVYEPSYVALLSSEGFEAPGKLCSITQTLHIMEDGSARPCSFISYTVGNVRREALRSIWKKMKSDKFLQKLASGDGLKGRCRECSTEVFA